MTRDRRRPLRLRLKPDPTTGRIDLDDPRLTPEERAALYREVYGEGNAELAQRAAEGHPITDVLDE